MEDLLSLAALSVRSDLQMKINIYSEVFPNNGIGHVHILSFYIEKHIPIPGYVYNHASDILKQVFI